MCAIYESYKRNIKKKEGPDPKDNDIQATLALNAFASENVMSFYEVAEGLDISKEIVSKLEASMDTIRESVANEFKKGAIAAESLYQEELERQLQLQEKDLSIEFEKKIILNHKLHQEEIDNIKSTHDQEDMRLQGERLEISKYNEKIEDEVWKLQQDKNLLENII
jgi:hypothetical protein